MKTPKRDYKTPANQLAQDIELDFFEPEYHAQEARWKRKNRVRQLKDKIARLTAENKWLSEERNKYIEFYFNALSDLVKLHEVVLLQREEKQ